MEGKTMASSATGVVTGETDRGLTFRETPRGRVAVDPPGWFWACWNCRHAVPLRGGFEDRKPDCPECARNMAVTGPASEADLPAETDEGTGQSDLTQWENTNGN
jgi:hypothetical protein